MKPRLLPLLCLLALLALPTCRAVNVQPVVGILSASSSLANEQNSGYNFAIDTGDFNLKVVEQTESNLQDEIQKSVRDMIEQQDKPVLALLGATQDQVTLRVAALSNFFNVPMVIPSAIGDKVMPENNLWGFRLSAPGSAHAAYLFENVLTRQSLAPKDENTKPLILGVFYEQNTFGETTAVATATAAMAQEIEIGYYGYFDPDSPDKESLIRSLKEMFDSRVNLVYIVASNPDTAQTVIRAFRDFYIDEETPLLIGQSGGFASRQFLDSSEASGLFILRQKIVPDRCPDEIETLTEAQSYAAIHLLNFAMEQSNDLLGTKDNPTLLDQREAIRDSLKTSSLNLPCLGDTAFDNSGQNKKLEFEFLYAENGAPRVVSYQILLDELIARLNQNPFELQ